MSFLLIKGEFNPQNGQPDGDSVRFLADDDTLFNQLDGRVKVKFKENGEVQLRYEAIDALEKAAIQPYSKNSLTRNLDLLGGSSNGQPGYILSSHTDPNGRPVCFVFAGDPVEADGTDITLDDDRLIQSVNYKLLSEGLVYPMFYEDFYKELRDVMVAATIAARKAKKGLWAADVSNTGVAITPPPALAKLQPIFPKLWRRLEAFYGRPSNKSKSAKAFLADLALGTDRLFTIPDQRWIKLSTALEVKGDKLRLKYKPEEMVFRG